MDIKLTNGKKTITRSKVQYEANINHFTKRGFKPLNDKPKKIIEKVESSWNDAWSQMRWEPK